MTYKKKNRPQSEPEESPPTDLSTQECEHAISQIAGDVRQEVQVNISSEHLLKDLAGSWLGNDAQDLLELVQKTRGEI